MLNILVLGAGSQIGRALSLRFASGNCLILVGRNKSALEMVMMECTNSGATKVDLIEHDLSLGLEQLMQKIGESQIDLVINLISATSRVKDSDLLPHELGRYLMSDLLVPVQLIQKLSDSTARTPDVIFISSILADVKSPDRAMYGALKNLQEICLRQLPAYSHGSRLLIVKIGKVISHDRFSADAHKLANKIYEAYSKNKKKIIYGFIGWIYLALFYVQPVVFGWIVRLQRLMRAYKS